MSSSPPCRITTGNYRVMKSLPPGSPEPRLPRLGAARAQHGARRVASSIPHFPQSAVRSTAARRGSGEWRTRQGRRLRARAAEVMGGGRLDVDTSGSFVPYSSTQTNVPRQITRPIRPNYSEKPRPCPSIIFSPIIPFEFNGRTERHVKINGAVPPGSRSPVRSPSVLGPCLAPPPSAGQQAKPVKDARLPESSRAEQTATIPLVPDEGHLGN